MARIYTYDAEEALIKAALLLHTEKNQWLALQLFVSSLDHNVRFRKNMQIAANLIRTELQGQETQVFLCHDADIVFLCNYSQKESLEKLLEKLTYLFLKSNISDPSTNEFYTFYQLEIDYDRFYAECDRKLAFILEKTKRVVESKQSFMPDKEMFKLTSTQRKQRMKPQIMIAEDHPFIRKMIGAALRSSGPLLIAKDGHEAVRLYYENAPDILFLDIEMPELDGHKVLHSITELDPDSFVIMLTVHANREDVLNAVKNGAKGYIIKPFTQKKLKQYIDQFRVEHKSLTGT